MSDRLTVVLAALNNHDLAAASDFCCEWREAEPTSDLANNLSGVVAMQAGDIQGAIRWFEAAIQLNPNYAKAWCNLGLAYKQFNRDHDALACLNKSSELAPSAGDIKYNLALSLHELGMNAEAIAILEAWPVEVPISAEAGWLLAKLIYLLDSPQKACELLASLVESYPERNELWRTYGDLLHEIGQAGLAVSAYREALALTAEDVESLRGLGNLLVKQGPSSEGMRLIQRAVELRPDDPEILVEYAQSLVASGIFLDARLVLQKALLRWPDNAVLHFNLGLIEGEHGDRVLAELSIRQAVALAPEMFLAHNYLGVLQERKGDFEEAAKSYRAALAFNKDFAEAYNSMGNLLLAELSLDEAELAFRESIRLKPDLAGAHHNLGLLLLLTGRFEAGWQEYGWRLRLPEAKPHIRIIDRPEWRGEDLAGKRIFVYAEQGFGDSLQFARYMPLLAEMGAEVIFEVPAVLLRLFGCLDGVNSLIQRGDPLPAFDYQVPLLTVPGLIGTHLGNIPCHVPYLKADSGDVQKWRDRLSIIDPGYRVGIVCAGSPKHRNDKCRSIDPIKLLPLASIDYVNWISLHKRQPGVEPAPCPMPLIDLTEDLLDYADTAALMENLDLVITVDTSVAHLAGALGKPVWIMLPFVPDWRWLLEQNISPWYPTVRLYRQKYAGNWEGVLEEIKKDLIATIVKQRAP